MQKRGSFFVASKEEERKKIMRMITYNMEYNNDRTPTLVKEKTRNYPEYDKLNTPHILTKFMSAEMHADRLPEEHCWMIAISTACKPLGLFEISHGGSSESIIDSKAVATRLLLCGATGFLLCHNHPSGDLSPSQSDREVTQKLVELAKVMDLGFTDHIIIGMDDDGHTNFFSFRESGLI